MEFLVELRLRNHEPESEKGKVVPIDGELAHLAVDAGSHLQARQEMEDHQPGEAGLNWDAA